MKIGAALTKIPWKGLFRFLPGVIGIAGELMVRSAELEKADALKRVEERQQVLTGALERLASQMKILFWVAVAALVVAVAALVVAMAG